MIASYAESVRKHLQIEYSGVFNEQQIDRHIQDYIGLTIAEQQVQIVLAGESIESLLDIGCGYGSFVFAARQSGINVIGIDTANFEINFARERLRNFRPQDNPELIYQLGNGSSLPFADGQFDVVTLWNVMEHISDDNSLLREVHRVLQRNGRVYVVCPNYAAFRSEAHYHLFWIPYFPRNLAIKYLRFRGKNPSFFESNIFYRTNWGMLQALHRNGFELCPDDLIFFRLINFNSLDKPIITKLITIIKRLKLMGFVRMILRILLYNPFKHSITVSAVKREKRL